MSKVDDRIQQIKTQLVGNTGVRVLLLEGPDDVDAFRILLDRQFVSWEQSWHLAPAGGKKAVLDMLEKEGSWLGLVDKDEWTMQEITARLTGQANLVVLPRFCIESYLVDPTELWEAFPVKQQDKIAGGLPQLRLELRQSLVQWIRQAALWHEVRPLWTRLRGLGFPDAVLGDPPMPNDIALREHFESWHEALNADAVLAKVHALEQQLNVMDETNLFTQWVYSKAFYPQVVHQTLNKLLGQKDAKKRRISIFRTRSIPPDLNPLWKTMGLMS
jgi:hypothetical protein